MKIKTISCAFTLQCKIVTMVKLIDFCNPDFLLKMWLSMVLAYIVA